MSKQPTKPTWTQVKRKLSGLNQIELLAVIHELYKLNSDNKVFLTSRYVEMDSETLMAPYCQAIRDEFNPKRGFPRLNLRAARKAINDFKQACVDPRPVADLMIFYVEQGAICTNSYGDIDDGFYNSLESVYAAAIKTLVETGNPELIEEFRPRLLQIVYDTSGIGWGFHDMLTEMYDNDFPPES